MLETLSDVVYQKTFTMDKFKGFEQRVLLSSDRHRDNPHSNRKLQKLHLEQARERGARVLDFGDLFCAMQGKGDPRGRKQDIRPEHMGENYLNSLVTTANNWFSPYADLFDMIGEGNHETSISRHHEFSLIDALVFMLNSTNNTQIQRGKYTGYIKFYFKDKQGRGRGSYLLNFTHGYGGGGPVTKGVIQTNRKAVYLPDADICVSGHIHEQWVIPIVRERITRKGQPYLDKQYHICLPTYKEEYLPGDGYHRERGRPPKPLGAWWLKFYYCTRDDTVKFKIIEADS